LHPTCTELVLLGELDTLGERTRDGNSLEVNGNRVCVEIGAIPDPDHTQEVTGSRPVAPTISSIPLGMPLSGLVTLRLE
jgi:hypothetical protein